MQCNAMQCNALPEAAQCINHAHTVELQMLQNSHVLTIAPFVACDVWCTVCSMSLSQYMVVVVTCRAAAIQGTITRAQQQGYSSMVMLKAKQTLGRDMQQSRNNEIRTTCLYSSSSSSSTVVVVVQS